MTVTEALNEKLRLVQYIATDFDGVHTDGCVLVGDDGGESVFCNRRDGLAYDALRSAKIGASIISKETNRVVAQRARKLQIPHRLGVGTARSKRDVLTKIAGELQMLPGQFLYIGDDVNDLEVLAWVGVPVCPADAHPRVLELVQSLGGYVTNRCGGEGVIREVVELLFEAKGLPFEF